MIQAKVNMTVAVIYVHSTVLYDALKEHLILHIDFNHYGLMLYVEKPRYTKATTYQIYIIIQRDHNRSTYN